MTYDCPECDSQVFIQTVTQIETITVDENGFPLEVDKNGMVEVHTIECGECGEVTV